MMNVQLPRIICERQAESWNCTITTWEYLTGVPRSTIAESLGHDGGAIWNHKLAPPSNRTGVLPSEIAWWAHRELKVKLIQLTARECYEHFNSRKCHTDIKPSVAELVDEIRGRLAALALKMPGSASSGHEVAWFGDFYVDPADGLPRDLKRDDLLAATVILEGLSLDERIDHLVADTGTQRGFASVATDWWLRQANLTSGQRESLAPEIWRQIAEEVLTLKLMNLAIYEQDNVLQRVCESKGITCWKDRFPDKCVMRIKRDLVEVHEPGEEVQTLWRAPDGS
jgi:hypothetical protein